jgi:cell wall-associated NlpC family hydrolase
MRFHAVLGAVFIACASIVQPALAEESAADAPETPDVASGNSDKAKGIIDRALDLVGIRYRRGGSNSDSGFDCSGFVGHVFRESLGLMLPRTSREISQTGAPVSRNDLEPGDLVFFHTMRRTFSHVGIYLGENQFVHAPRPGQNVSVADLREHYWAGRYNGARRINSD